ncbi:ATP-dependent DNA ligase [Rhodococcus sp. NM-2]|uniref:ATP-dependent DNA ligase n=1 Tax=Rhodococcus TaxID=1827 RepID=UPI0024753DF8|nr:ATP-dependent DNA ligase [Rhodococcus opacus]MDH6291715.1 bifunctional non-homologous end joining protein LigD [Rhodococcus opacus]
MSTRTIDGHRLHLTHLDKVLYPSVGTTKGEVIDYLAEIAPAMVPHLAQRPVTRKRWPDGVDSDSFFERNLPSSTPKWVPRLTVQHKDRSVDYPLIDSAAGLVLMGQLAALELHVPQWTVVDGKPGPATRLVFDLDPGEGMDLSDCARVALAVKEQLDDAGLTSFPVTSGSKGIHVYASLTAKNDIDPSPFARTLAKRLEKDSPESVTATMAKTDRRGKVFLDWSQNNVAKTTVTPYSLRGRSEPTVAAPREWKELEATDLRQLRFDEVLDRYRSEGDLLSASLDSLRTYRSKRKRGKTPEPVPAPTADSPSADSGRALSFVVHEHHATNLHWDFRLERDGVLVSWAVPKGVPRSASKNRLAVQTEDHPLDYRTFSGTIPKDQYGGGRVDIFDEGTYVPIKWERDEILFELRGRRLHGQYVLIRTKDDQWLMHKIKKDKERPLPHSESDQEPASAPSKPADEKPMPRDLKPMLATLGSDQDLPDMPADLWSFEGKWDGIRAIAEISDGKVHLHSRSGRDLTATYPELASIGDTLADHDVVLDGEIVTLDSAGVTSFAALQNRSGLQKPAAITAAAQKYPAEFYVFDVLYLDGASLLRHGYADRRRVLEELASSTGLTVPARLRGDAAEALAESRRRGWEGIVGKKNDSTYLTGRRGKAWIKVKNQRTQEVIVGGWRRGKGSRSDTLGSLLLGIPDTDGLRYVGRVGTGFTEPMLESLTRKLERLSRKTSPFTDTLTTAQRKDANWVTPRLVGEVGFTEWTTANLLRHPTWRGLRTDKNPEDVRRE